MRVVNRIALCITVLVALPGALALAGSPAADRTQRFAWSGWMPAARAAARQAAEAPAQADPDVYEAAFDFRFLNRPKVTGPAQAPAVAIEGESLWRNPGDPVVPVRFASLALPPGTEIADVHVELGPPEVIARDVDALATTPQPLPTDVPRAGDESDRATRARFQQWLNALWEEKDMEMARLLGQGGAPA